ncbi:MAG: ABC transporter permease subunit [Methylococcales bacterium]|nr:ABC transporter permease subunit [Methylococcales bacterium]
MILVIAAREFKTQFLSPLAWTILAILQFILAFLFLKQVETFIMIQPQLATMDNAPSLTDITVTPLFGIAGIIFLLVTPLLTMRLICEERRNKTLSLLLSAPLSNTEIIIGKYLGSFGLSALIVLLITIMPLSLLMGGTLDFAKVFANILALLLLTGAFSSIGLYMSCVAESPTVAATSAFGAIFLLWILDWSTGLTDKPSELFKYLSILRHFQNIQSGLINTLDISYFLIFISFFIMLSIRRLDKEHLQK